MFDFPWKIFFFQSQSRGIRGGGRAPALLLMSASLRGGHSWGGGSFIIITSSCISLPQAIFIFYIALHCTHPNAKIKKRIKIYSDSQQYSSKLCLINCITLNIHVSHFENWLFLFVCPLQKWQMHFLLQKRWRNEGFKGTSDKPFYKWSVPWNYARIPFKNNYIVKKKYFKISLLPLTKQVLFKDL